MASFIISNSFPFSLIRRRVVVEPRGLEELRLQLKKGSWQSTWGHTNTVANASSIVGVDLRPCTERPAIDLSSENLPLYNGQVFDECWLLSPQYLPGYRPQPGEQTPSEKIIGWQVLQIKW